MMPSNDTNMAAAAHRPADLLGYYHSIEQASAEMVQAAKCGDWALVVQLESTCAVLIAELKQASSRDALRVEDHKAKARIMQRILLNDAEIRYLAEPWLDELDRTLAARPRTLH